MPNQKSQMEDRDASHDEAETGEYEQESLRRAAVIERYENLRAQRDKWQQDEVDTESEGETESNGVGLVAACREFLNPHRTQKSIVDIKTTPSVDAESLDEALDPGEISLLRFVFADGTKTKWYSFDGKELDDIVEFYADGSLGRMLDPRVEVEVYPQTFDIQSENRIEIMFPTPRDKHTGHLKYQVQRRLNALNTIEFNNETLKHLQPKAAISSALVFGTIIPLALVSVLFLSDPVWSIGIAIAIGLCVHLVQMIYIDETMYQHETYMIKEHYWFLWIPLRYVWSQIEAGLGRLNQR